MGGIGNLQLFQFKLKRNLLYAGFIGLVIGLYLLLVLPLLVLVEIEIGFRLILLGLVITIAALGFGPLEEKIRQWTNTLFYLKRASYHHTIKQMLHQMNSCTDLNGITESIVSTIYNEVKVEKLAFFLKSSDQKYFEIIKHRAWQDLQSIPINDVLVNYLQNNRGVIEKARLVSFWQELWDSGSRLRNREVFYRLNKLGAEVVVPFFEQAELLGFLLIGPKVSGDIYYSEELHLLESIGHQTTLGLKNARLYEISQNKVKELTTLFEVAKMMSSTLDIKEIYTNIIKSVLKVINVDRGILFLYDNRTESLYSVAGSGADEKDIMGITLKVGDSVLGRIFKQGHPVLVPQITRNTEYVRRLGVKSYIVVPMKAKDKIIGLLTIDNAPSGRSLENINMDLLMTLAGQMAIAIENAKLYDDAKERVRELSDLNQKLRRTDRISALGTMVAGVAHEIKNPLTSMKMFVQLMEENKGSADFWNEYGQIISNEVMRLETIVEDFLGFARMPEVDIKPVKLIEIIQKVYQLVKTQARKEDVEIIVNVDENIIVSADTQKIMQVFLNLVLNSIQAMPKERLEKGKVEFNATQSEAKNQAIIEVKDNGCGIPKENLEKLFTPFFTTKQKGTGLGLSIAHKIIEEHGGSIEVSSEVGVGTIFTIKLPLANPANIAKINSVPVR